MPDYSCTTTNRNNSYFSCKIKTGISIVVYASIAIVLCGHDVYYASAWSSSNIIPLSQSSPSSSKASRITSSTLCSINTVFRIRRGQHNCNRDINNRGVIFAALDFNSNERASVSSSLSASSSSEIDTDTDTDININIDADADVDNGSRISSDLSEEDALPFLGVGRLYHDSKSKPSSTPLDIIERLAKSTVAIVGIGGVGSWAAEAICRSGVGNIILVDLDDICVSNINRQVHATSTTVGRMKTEEMGRRLVEINPACNVTILHDFVSVDNAYTMVENLKPEIDIILDAIDGATEKAALIAAACVHSVPIVTCGGAAGRMDPTQIVCDDLAKCADCRLLFSCKKMLRDGYKLFTKGPSDAKEIRKYRPRKWRIAAVFSTELQKKVEEDGVASSLRLCDGALGTACFVTGTYGFVAASKVVSMITNEQLVTPRVLQSSVERIKRTHHELQSSDEREEEFNFL